MAGAVPLALLKRLGVNYCRSLLKTLRTADESGSLVRLLDIDQPTHKDPTNITRKVDDIAERLCITFFDAELGDAVERYGEEGKPLPVDIRNRKKTIILIDPIDGTDLIARGFSNWCSALTFFCPQNPVGKRILLTMVAHGSGPIYYATQRGAFVEFPQRICSVVQGTSKRTSFKKRTHRPHRQLRVSQNTPKALNDSTVCFFGQKAKYFLSAVGQPLLTSLQSIDELTQNCKQNNTPVPLFRLYNFGGNPMLAKIADGTVDAVFQVLGPQPHDLVPGAFIAMKAGAIGERIGGGSLDLEELLLDPSDRTGYIVATSKQLVDQVRGLIRVPDH